MRGYTAFSRLDAKYAAFLNSDDYWERDMQVPLPESEQKGHELRMGNIEWKV